MSLKSLKSMAFFCVALGLAAFIGCTGGRQPVDQAQAPNVVYLNGIVITMDSTESIAEAVALKDGKIIDVGKTKDIKALAGKDTTVVDLDGKTLLPGFYDAHSHFPSIGIATLYRVDLNSPPIGNIKDMDGIIAALKAKAEEMPEGEWIGGRGYDDTLIAEKRHPTRWDLDKASTKHPIWISHISGHLGVANSKALKMARVTKETPQPEGGVIRMDPETREPNGVFEEGPAMSKVSRLIPAITDEQWLEGLKYAVKDYAEEGVTTVVIAGGGKQSVERLMKASEMGLLPLRVISMANRAFQESLPPDFNTDMLKVGAVKMYQDGSIQGYTGYLSKPYHVPFMGDESYLGYPIRSREKLTEMVKAAHKAGFQVAIHGNGDAAIDDILYAFQEAQKEFPREDCRHRIEHCQMVREEQLDLIKEMGVTPSYFVSHTYYWGDRHRDIFMGPERAFRMSPLYSSLDRGIKFTIHCDTPVTPMDPLLAVWAGVNRISTGGNIIGPEQRVKPIEALRAVTSYAAWQNFEEDIKGSIEKGKFADFVILADNPLEIDPVKIKDIEVLETIVGGKTVFKK
jgi:predicted amidohydrolase YtcJ